jgi:hypothetical protein
MTLDLPTGKISAVLKAASPRESRSRELSDRVGEATSAP